MAGAEEGGVAEPAGNGGLLDEVAAELNYFRRTASRRLAAARDALGVATNAEAISAVSIAAGYSLRQKAARSWPFTALVWAHAGSSRSEMNVVRTGLPNGTA